MAHGAPLKVPRESGFHFRVLTSYFLLLTSYFLSGGHLAGGLLQRGEAAHEIIAVCDLPGGFALCNGNPDTQIFRQLHQADKLPVEIAVHRAAFGSGLEKVFPHCNYDNAACAGADRAKSAPGFALAPKIRMIPIFALVITSCHDMSPARCSPESAVV